MNTAVKNYYDKLASTYDENRFANSYGRYLHRQEAAVLNRYLGPLENRAVLDLACGTGRFMDYCTVGADFSSEMVAAAKAKHPDKSFVVENALQTGFDRESLLPSFNAPQLDRLGKLPLGGRPDHQAWRPANLRRAFRRTPFSTGPQAKQLAWSQCLYR